MKAKFNILTSTCVPLPLENVDTDQIIPARFLKATTKEGFGENLFRDWRYDKQGNKIESFVLNDPTYGGQILVAGKNFGSGSSREHAAWAIAQNHIGLLCLHCFIHFFHRFTKHGGNFKLNDFRTGNFFFHQLNRFQRRIHRFSVEGVKTCD